MAVVDQDRIHVHTEKSDGSGPKSQEERQMEFHHFATITKRGYIILSMSGRNLRLLFLGAPGVRVCAAGALAIVVLTRLLFFIGWERDLRKADQ